jgi:hypothetical protein
MIESNVIELLDFGDSIQKLDIYSKHYLESYFKFIRTIIKHKPFPIILDIILMIISFMQILCISAIFLSSENDLIIQIFHYMKKVLIFSEIITKNNLYIKLFSIISIIILLDIFLIFMFSLKIIKLKIIIIIANFINIIIYYYLIGPAILINLICFRCEDGKHIFLSVDCFSSSTHIKYIISSILIGIFYIFIAIFYSIYGNEINAISSNINDKIFRINCNYELFNLIYRIMISVIYFAFKNKTILFHLIFEIFSFIINITMSIYIHKYVYYYNNIINYINYSGWCFCSWFTLCANLKILFKINGITYFIIVGWIIIIIIVYKMHNIEENLLISNTDYSKLETIKSIEMFKNKILQILDEQNNNIKSKILLHGIIKNFEELISSNAEYNYIYNTLLNNKYLKNKLNPNDELPLYSILYLLYYIQILRSNEKELVLYMCYFLIDKFKNAIYAIFLCSKVKLTKHIHLYYKYLLTEDIKEQVLYDLKKKIKQRFN